MGPSRSSAASRADGVTMVFSQYRSARFGGRVLVFSGTVASGASGETVDVLGQDCGQRDYRLIGSTPTRAGGGWQLENPGDSNARVESGTTFRARWNGHFSNPYLWRVPANIGVIKIPGRRAWRVLVSPPQFSNVSMKGKIVELQRRSGGRWVRYRRARLVHKPSYEHGALTHDAVFAVSKRGLRLRAFLPARSAAPCYLAGVTQPWRS
jgi:hypothetical protein